jgi:hypothetical protein
MCNLVALPPEKELPVRREQKAAWASQPVLTLVDKNLEPLVEFETRILGHPTHSAVSIPAPRITKNFQIKAFCYNVGAGSRPSEAQNILKLAEGRWELRVLQKLPQFLDIYSPHLSLPPLILSQR